LNPSDANIVGHIIDKKSGEHLPYINVFLQGTTIGTVSDGTGHFYLKNLPEGKFTIVMKSVGYKTIEKEIVSKKGKTRRSTSKQRKMLCRWTALWYLPTGTKQPDAWLLRW